MKLQLALDTFNLENAMSLMKKAVNSIDIIEIGTPFIIEYGLETVRRFRQAFPDKLILADTKIMDAGQLETSMAFEAGADYITVLAVTDAATIKACVETAKKYNRKVVADMICVDDIPSKVRLLEELEVHGIAVHTGVDQQSQGHTPLKDLELIQAACSKFIEVFVAGGITLETVSEYTALMPEVLIVGGAIGNAADPAEMARLISDRIKKA